jgi:hypothetical protein
VLVLQQSFDDREVAVRSSQPDGTVVVHWRIDALISQQSFDDREVAVLSSHLHGFVGAGRQVDALVLQQQFDDGDVAVLSGPSNGAVVVGWRIDHRVSEQIIDDVDVAVLSGSHKGVVKISMAMQLAGFEHALHIRQSTMRSVITECFKFDFARHLQSSRPERREARTARHVHVQQCVML